MITFHISLTVDGTKDKGSDYVAKAANVFVKADQFIVNGDSAENALTKLGKLIDIEIGKSLSEY